MFRRPMRLEKWIAYDGALGVEVLGDARDSEDSDVNADDQGGHDDGINHEAGNDAAGDQTFAAALRDLAPGLAAAASQLGFEVGDYSITLELPDPFTIENTDELDWIFPFANTDDTPYFRSGEGDWYLQGSNFFFEVDNPNGGRFVFLDIDEVGDTRAEQHAFILKNRLESLYHNDRFDQTWMAFDSGRTDANDNVILTFRKMTYSNLTRQYYFDGSVSSQDIPAAVLQTTDDGFRFIVTDRGYTEYGNHVVQTILHSVVYDPADAGQGEYVFEGYGVNIYYHPNYNYDKNPDLFGDGESGIFREDNAPLGSVTIGTPEEPDIPGGGEEDPDPNPGEPDEPDPVDPGPVDPVDPDPDDPDPVDPDPEDPDPVDPDPVDPPINPDPVPPDPEPIDPEPVDPEDPDPGTVEDVFPEFVKPVAPESDPIPETDSATDTPGLSQDVPADGPTAADAGDELFAPGDRLFAIHDEEELEEVVVAVERKEGDPVEGGDGADAGIDAGIDVELLEVVRDVSYWLGSVEEERHLLALALTRLRDEYLFRNREDTASVRISLRELFASGNRELAAAARVAGEMRRHVADFENYPIERRDGLLMANIRELIDGVERRSGETTAFAHALDAVSGHLRNSRLDGTAMPTNPELNALFRDAYDKALAAWRRKSSRADPMGRDLAEFQSRL